MSIANLAIRHRLLGGFTVVLALTVLLAAMAWVQVQRIGQVVQEINDSWVVSLIQLNEMRSALSEARQSEQRYVLAIDPKVRDQEETVRAAALARFPAA